MPAGVTRTEGVPEYPPHLLLREEWLDGTHVRTVKAQHSTHGDHTVKRHRAVQYSAVQYSAVQCSAVQYSAVQYRVAVARISRGAAAAEQSSESLLGAARTHARTYSDRHSLGSRCRRCRDHRSHSRPAVPHPAIHRHRHGPAKPAPVRSEWALYRTYVGTVRGRAQYRTCITVMMCVPDARSGNVPR